MGTKEKKDKIQEGVEKYLIIKDLYSTTYFDVNNDFAKKFATFYRVRRNKKWRETFFKLFAEIKSGSVSADFKTILEKLKENTHRIEASFASKMLHTLDNDSPIWDKKVIDFLVEKGIIERPKPYGDKRLKERIKTFQDIKEWYKNRSNIQPLVDYFNQNYKTGRSDEISDVKKADFIIWGLDLDKVLEIADSTPAGV